MLNMEPCHMCPRVQKENLIPPRVRDQHLHRWDIADAHSCNLDSIIHADELQVLRQCHHAQHIWLHEAAHLHFSSAHLLQFPLNDSFSCFDFFRLCGVARKRKRCEAVRLLDSPCLCCTGVCLMLLRTYQLWGPDGAVASIGASCEAQLSQAVISSLVAGQLGPLLQTLPSRHSLASPQSS